MTMVAKKKESSKKKVLAPVKKTAVTNIPPPPGADAACEELDEYFSKYTWGQLEKAGHMRRLNKSELAWMSEVADQAKSRVEARKNRAQLNLALPVSELVRFTQYAKKKHIPPSTLARAWILERLDQESKAK
jgi:hypothetical protein